MMDELEYSLVQTVTKVWAWKVDFGGMAPEEKGVEYTKEEAMGEIAMHYCSYLETALMVLAEDFGQHVVSKMIDHRHDDLYLAALEYIEDNEDDPDGMERYIVVFIPESDLMDGM